MAEWLRRWTANPLGSARVGSNPILVGKVLSRPGGLFQPIKALFNSQSNNLIFRLFSLLPLNRDVSVEDMSDVAKKGSQILKLSKLQ